MKTYQVASYRNKAVTVVEATSAAKAAGIVLGVEAPVKQMGSKRGYGNAKGRACTASVEVFLPDEVVPDFYLNH